MNKSEFVEALYSKLHGLPEREVKERVDFYIEMIDDRIEDGSSEQDAVSAVGSVDDIAAQITADIPFAKIAKEKMKPKNGLRTWEIVLLALGSPIWFSLAIAALAVIFSVYVVLWSVIISVWAVFVSFAACAFVGVFVGSAFIAFGNALSGIAVIGAGIFCAGASIFLLLGSKAATKGIIMLTGKIALGIKRCFAGKGTVQ